MMWLVFQPPDTRCDLRTECARDLLSNPSGVIADQTTLKIRALFADELGQTQHSGTVSHTLYQLIYEIANTWELHTQEVLTSLGIPSSTHDCLQMEAQLSARESRTGSMLPALVALGEIRLASASNVGQEKQW